MKKITFLFSLVTSFLIAAVIGTPVANFIGANPAIVTGTLFAAPFVVKATVYAILGFLPSQQNGFAYMAVQKETWVDYIMGNLFKDNEFLNHVYNEGDFVLNGKVVHIPQAGSIPNVVKNRTALPGTTVQRADTDVTYALDWYTSDPTVITNAEEKEVSYDKMGSVIGEHISGVNQAMADDLLYKWSPTLAAQIIRTSGTADAVALAPGATGTRNALTLADLRAAKVKMNKAGVLKTDRFALIPDDMLSQLMSDTKMTQFYMQQLMDIKEGTVARIEGFTIMTRVAAGIYDTSAVPKLITAATATTDNLSVLCWQQNGLAKALGLVDFFSRPNDPQYYGDIYSVGVRCGGRIRRSLQESVVAIVQQ